MYTRKYSPAPPPNYSGTAFVPPEPLLPEREKAETPLPVPALPYYPLESREAFHPTPLPSFSLPALSLPSSLSQIPEDDLLLIGLFLLILYGKEDGIRENGDALLLLAFLYLYGREAG